MYRLSITALGVAALAVIVLGCGSSGSGTNASATSAPSGVEVTKAQFIKQAEAICVKNAKERTAAIAAWEKQAPADGAASVEEALIKIVAPALTEEAEALKALEPPAGEQANVAKMIENLSKGSSAVEKGSPGPEVAQFAQEAAAFGMKACGAL
jgi:hypothetical protein